MATWQEEQFTARRAAADAQRAAREREREAQRRERAKSDEIEHRDFPTDRHIGNAPADRARRPKRPGDYSASRDRLWGL